MKVTQHILDCETPKEVVEWVDLKAKATLREWKRRLLEESLESLVFRHLGPKWLKIRERKPTPGYVFSVVPEKVIRLKAQWTLPALSHSEGRCYPDQSSPA